MDHTDLTFLPEEVQAAIEGSRRVSEEVVASLGVMVSKLRDESVEARRESGIEQVWLECEEMYLGIDDMNRSDFAGARWAKSTTMEGPLVKRGIGESSNDRASAYIKLAARYVDAGTSKVCEIALPVDGKAFTLHATPVPSLDAMERDQRPAESLTGVPMPNRDGQPVTVSDLAKHQKRLAEDAASKASEQIWDWMVEYKHPAELRKVIFDGARIGVGVLKGPFARTSNGVKVTKSASGQIQIKMVSQTKPIARWLDPWLFYPAKGCGEDIHAGGHCFELAPMLATELMDLAEDPTYIAKNIEKVIAEGPGRSNKNDTGVNPHRQELNRRWQFDVWHFYGRIPKSAFQAANPKQAMEFEDELAMVKDTVSAIVTIVNNTVIRAILHPLESGRLPFHTFNWRRRAGHWAGVGVAEQVKTPQQICNAATRAMLNNAARSSGSQVVVDAEAVMPANGKWEIVGDKLWYLNKGSGVDDVRKAFGAFEWPNTTDQLMKIVEYAFRLAEEHSSIPLITQGQSGDTTPDTFSGQQLQDNNAQQLLRDVGFGLNDTVSTPFVDQLYEWLLLDPSVGDDVKGDYQVDTSGALAIIEKALQDSSIMAMGTMLSNKAFRISESKWFESWCRSRRMNPAEFQYSDDEWEKITSQPPPEPVPVQVAKINVEGKVQASQIGAEVAKQRITSDTDRDTAYTQALSERAQMEHDKAMQELALRRELAMLDYANKHSITLDMLKTQLAETTMKLNTQRELGMLGVKADLHKHHNPPPVITPPTEPAGKAKKGRAFQA